MCIFIDYTIKKINETKKNCLVFPDNFIKRRDSILTRIV